MSARECFTCAHFVNGAVRDKAPDGVPIRFASSLDLGEGTCMRLCARWWSSEPRPAKKHVRAYWSCDAYEKKP